MGIVEGEEASGEKQQKLEGKRGEGGSSGNLSWYETYEKRKQWLGTENARRTNELGQSIRPHAGLAACQQPCTTFNSGNLQSWSAGDTPNDMIYTHSRNRIHEPYTDLRTVVLSLVQVLIHSSPQC